MDSFLRIDKLLNFSNKINKFIIIFSALITGWTSILLLSNTNFNTEIKDVIYKMYLNQKDFVLNVKDLSILLVKDAHYRFSSDHKYTNKFMN